ncbi:MAG: acyltransferase [Desulfobulbaceae bacterium]|nr:acyltransferase [Desulfobulbaceae bacterium]
MSLKYRPDIDGLRAIAVLVVIFFHTGVPGFSGGFVGVDIFFVISGFLITSIILKDIKEEKFSIALFYERRIRRIFPALFPVIAVTLAIATCLFDAKIFKDFGHSITATTLFSSNILFCQESGYFAAPSLQKPLLHTWSLAVEEQFYIFFPLALIFIHRYLKSRYLLWILIAISLSLGASIYGVYHYPGVTFYFVPPRAWELLAGSLLALGVIPNVSSLWLKNIFAVVGVGLITYSVCTYTEATTFPGHNAMPPVIGASLIIYSNMDGKGSVFSRLISLTRLGFIGLISYSLYLWHWPFVAFAKYLMFRPFNGYESAGIIIATLVISTLSWKYIEQPFRGKQMLLPERQSLFYAAGVLMIVFSGIGGVIHLFNGMGYRIERLYPGTNATMQKLKQDTLGVEHAKWDIITKKIGQGAIPPVVGARDTTPSFALIGDSHARALIPMLTQEALKKGISGYIMTSNDHPPLLGIDQISEGYDQHLNRTNNALVQFIEQHKNVKTVFLAARWARYTKGVQYGSEDAFTIHLKESSSGKNSFRTNALLVQEGLSRMVAKLLDMKCRVILVTAVPEIGNEVPRIISLHTRFPMLVNMDELLPTFKKYNERQLEVQRILSGLAQLQGVTLIHPESRMFDEKGKVRIMADGEMLYNDDDHLSTAGALYVAPVFEEVFKEIENESKKAVHPELSKSHSSSIRLSVK